MFLKAFVNKEDGMISRFDSFTVSGNIQDLYIDTMYASPEIMAQ